MEQEKRKVSFVGAGPGAVDLITVRGKKVIDHADCIIYAGSLVNPALFSESGAVLHDSSKLDLDQIIEIIKASVDCRKKVARVHTGDPSLFGAIREQMVRLDQLGITYEVIPGVTSAFGAASSLGVELTLPEKSQTVIFTRKAGRTTVPEKESLTALSRHRATMMIFLSVQMIDDVIQDLLMGGYDRDTPVSVVQRATWDDETIVTGTLQDIAAKVKRARITKTAIIAVGAAFGKGELLAESKLYDKTFSHAERKARR